jgi:hypothetical protein
MGECGRRAVSRGEPAAILFGPHASGFGQSS